VDIIVAIIMAAILAGASLLAWIAYLHFCRFLVKFTNSSASLRDAAVAAKVFRAAGPAAMAKVIGRGKQ
jgi:hypothetical protein